MNPQARVGVGVFILKDGRFLMLQRHGSHGSGTWSVPGGHLEYGESFEDTAVREVKEETDLTISNVRFAAVTNDLFKEEDKHYVTIWVLSDYESGIERITEPDKCVAMEWRDLDDLPEPLFLPWAQLKESEFLAPIRDELRASA